MHSWHLPTAPAWYRPLLPNDYKLNDYYDYKLNCFLVYWRALFSASVLHSHLFTSHVVEKLS